MTGASTGWPYLRTSTFASHDHSCALGHCSLAVYCPVDNLSFTSLHSSLTSFKENQCNFNENLSRSKVRLYHLHKDLYSSCPCIYGNRYCEQVTLPPLPPPRRAESFICVANHIHTRALVAQQSYHRLLASVLTKRGHLLEGNMTHQPDVNHNLGNSINPTDSNEINGQTESLISPQTELSTPAFTPPSPIVPSFPTTNSDKCGFSDNEANHNSSPMFIYSYDPPTPTKVSVYDPPLPSFHRGAHDENDAIQVDEMSDENDNYSIETKKNTSTINTTVIRSDSNMSSSTLSASLLLTQDSDISPLPPHAVRVSPVHTETLTPSSSAEHNLTIDPTATYTCTSPACSIFSDVIPLTSDLSTITSNNFNDRRDSEQSSRSILTSENSDSLEGHTPDTICVSPIHSERNTHSHSKNSEDASLPTESLSQKKSNGLLSDPTNASSDLARRSSPASSPDPSLSSLPSDTITMNAAIESIGTDSDVNENSTWSSGANINSESNQYNDDTDQTIDSAFASPSISPSFTRSCTMTPIAVEKLDPSVISSNAINKPEITTDNECIIPICTDAASPEQHVTANSFVEIKVDGNSPQEFVDETTESESIYPESECDIRLVSRADTDCLDPAQRDSSPEGHSTPIIADICNFESDNNTQSLKDTVKSLEHHEIPHRILNEISSSGNSSMSNSPALSSEPYSQIMKRVAHDECMDKALSARMSNAHLSNWLNQNERSYNSSSNYTYSLAEDLKQDQISQPINFTQENGVLIGELASESQNHPGFNGVRNFSYFGPLPTIHEVVDTSADQTPANESSAFINIHNSNFDSQSYASSIMSSLVYSDSPHDVSTSKNTHVPLPPPPPPRLRVPPLKTPPIPPPPSDDDVNLYPLPPLPSEEACLPPLPPPPFTLFSEVPPPIPPHTVTPTPPQRMYLLIPITSGLRSPRRLSPPPAPPRSTSLRRSPPPPPPRSAVQTPSAEYQAMGRNGSLLAITSDDYFDDDDNRTPSSPSEVGSVICVSKLTPVPEERSPTNLSPLPPALLVATENTAVDYYKSFKCSPSRESSNVINNSLDTINNNISSVPQEPHNVLHNQVDKPTSQISLALPSLSKILGSSPSPSPPPPPPRPKIQIYLTPPLPPLPLSNKTFLTEANTLDTTQKSSETENRLNEQIIFKSTEDSNQNMSTQPQTHPLPPPPPTPPPPPKDKRRSPLRPPPPPPPKSPLPPPPPPPQKREPPNARSPPTVAVSEATTSREDSSEAPPRFCASPLLSISNYGKLIVDRSDIALLPPDEEVGRVFSSGLRWGWLDDSVDTVAMYTQLRPIIQHGPQCGLVALSMASQLCSGGGSPTTHDSDAKDSTPTPTPTPTPSTPSGGGASCGPRTKVPAEDLLEAARGAGFSTHGEMFSAEAMASLANQKLGDCFEAAVCRGILDNKQLFLELMLAGALLLVPYDAQHNHQPGTYKGHKAHWCVVSGALVQSRLFSSGTTSAASFARPDQRINFLWHVRRGHHSSSRSSSRGPSRAGADSCLVTGDSRRARSGSPPTRPTEAERLGRSMTPSRSGFYSSNQFSLAVLKQVSPEDMNVIVLWRQGKSRALVASSLQALCDSNAQLVEYPQAGPQELESDYVIGNVEDGLAGQVVVLNRTTQPLTTLSELLDRIQCCTPVN